MGFASELRDQTQPTFSKAWSKRVWKLGTECDTFLNREGDNIINSFTL